MNLLTRQVLDRTKKLDSKNQYKTTSFTLLKQDHLEFKAACKKLDRMPSEVLREMVLIFVEGSRTLTKKVD